MGTPSPIFFSKKTGDLFLLIAILHSGSRPLFRYFGHAKNSPLLLWGPLFVGVPVCPNMLNMPKSAAGCYISEHKHWKKLVTYYRPSNMATTARIGRSVLVEVLVCNLHLLPMSGDSPTDYINSSNSLHARGIRSLILDAELLCPAHPAPVMIGLATRSNAGSSATTKNTARSSCLVGVLYDISRKRIC